MSRGGVARGGPSARRTPALPTPQGQRRMHRPGTCDRCARWAPLTGPCHRHREPHPNIQAQVNWPGHPSSTRGPHVAPHLHLGKVTALRPPSTEHPAGRPGLGLGIRVCGSALPVDTQGNALTEETNHPRAACVALPAAWRRPARCLPGLVLPAGRPHSLRSPGLSFLPSKAGVVPAGVCLRAHRTQVQGLFTHGEHRLQGPSGDQTVVSSFL